MTFKTIAFFTFLLSSINIYSQIKFDLDILNLNKKENISLIELKSYDFNFKKKEIELARTEVFTFNSKGQRVLYSSDDYFSRKDSILYDSNNNIKEVFLFNKDGSKKERIHAFYDSENNLISVKYYLYKVNNEQELYNAQHLEKETLFQ